MGSYYVRALVPDDWKIFSNIRLQALREHPGVYLGSYKAELRISETDWREMLNGKGKCIFGLFEDDSLIGIAAVFTWSGDTSGQSGVMAMAYIDSAHRGQHLSKLLYEARINWAKEHVPFRRLVISHREGNEPSRRANQAFNFKYTRKELIEWPDDVKAFEHTYELDLEALRRT